MILRGITTGATTGLTGRAKNRSAWFSGFSRDPANPIAAFLPTEAWEEGGTQEDLKLIDVGTTRYGFYACSRGSGDRVIAYASTPIASYPAGWAKCAAPVILPGQVEGVDDVLVSAPVPLAMPDGTFRLYAHAYNGTTECGVVYSAPAITGPWTYVDVVLTGAGWCSATVRPEIVVPSWLAPDGLWHTLFGGNGAVTDAGFKIGHGKCSDGLLFVKDAAPVVALGAGTSWDSEGQHPVGQWIKVGTTFYFLFQGLNADHTHWQLGVFETDDFVTFYKWPYPVLTVGSGEDPDAGTVENAGLVYDATAGTIDLWYCANDSYGASNYRICFARAIGQVQP